MGNFEHESKEPLTRMNPECTASVSAVILKPRKCAVSSYHQKLRPKPLSSGPYHSRANARFTEHNIQVKASIILFYSTAQTYPPSCTLLQLLLVKNKTPPALPRKHISHEQSRAFPKMCMPAILKHTDVTAMHEDRGYRKFAKWSHDILVARSPAGGLQTATALRLSYWISLCVP